MAHRERFVIGNWKMNPSTSAQAQKLLHAYRGLLRGTRGVKIVVCPPILYLPDLRRSYKGTALSFGAQDASAEVGGAHTGEISALMLKDAKISYCILGHSERRAKGESDEIISKKVGAALRAGLQVILCVGERERDREALYLATLEHQITAGFSDVSPELLRRVLVAYEPVWAIGKTAEDAMAPEEVHEMVIFVRKILSQKYGTRALTTPVLYGGSVEPANAQRLLTRGEISGFLVGHASLDPQAFEYILSAFKQ